MRRYDNLLTPAAFKKPPGDTSLCTESCLHFGSSFPLPPRPKPQKTRPLSRSRSAPTIGRGGEGRSSNGVADANQKPPLKWSATENIVWKTPIRGRGHGSPIVVGDKIFLASADDQGQWVLCYQRRTGKLLWQNAVHRGGLDKSGNGKSSLASSTIACDGKRIFANFLQQQSRLHHGPRSRRQATLADQNQQLRDTSGFRDLSHRLSIARDRVGRQQGRRRGLPALIGPPAKSFGGRIGPRRPTMRRRSF